MDDRVSLSERVDGEDVADVLNEWADATPGNRRRWHDVVLATLAPTDADARVLAAEVVTIEDLSPLDPLDEDPSPYNATATVDARIERRPPGDEPEIEEVVAALVVVELSATVAGDGDGAVEVLVHGVAVAGAT